MKVLNRLLFVGAAAVVASIVKKNIDRKNAEADLWATATDSAAPAGTATSAAPASEAGTSGAPSPESAVEAAASDAAAGDAASGATASGDAAAADAWGEATDRP